MPLADILRSMILPRGRLGPLAFAIPAAAVLLAHFALRYGVSDGLTKPPRGGATLHDLRELLPSRLAWAACGIATANLALARLRDTGWGSGLLSVIMLPAYVLLAASISTTVPGAWPATGAGLMAHITADAARLAYFAYSGIVWLLLMVLPSQPADNAHGPATRAAPAAPKTERDQPAAWAEAAVQAIETRKSTLPAPAPPRTAAGSLQRATFGRRA
jgi:uncharacterized membrane protein YhaH (DUF805 family)